MPLLRGTSFLGHRKAPPHVLLPSNHPPSPRIFQNLKSIERLLYRHNYVHIPGEISDVFDGEHYRTLCKQNVVVDGQVLPHKYFSGKFDICLRICMDSDLLFKQNRGKIPTSRRTQWLANSEIDYRAVRDRVLKLGGPLIFAFSRAQSKLKYTYALYGRKCGYYGPKGEFLINSTLVRLLSKDESDLSYNLYDTVRSIIQDDPERFDEEAEGEVSTLIEFKDFISFILAPFTALLIAEEMDIDLAEAHDIRDNSNEFGDVMQPDDDKDEQVDVLHRVETLHRENIQAMKGTTNVFFSQRPPRRQKNSQDDALDSKMNSQPTKPVKPLKSKLNARTLTLDDYPEPSPKVKKQKGKAQKTQAFQTRAEKPSKQNVIESNYGTRSKTRK
ncbi:hypothetical protein B0H13DRAFT_2300819 [Mycena leptocephala]|nr:hypothetical protein B0H13DRAFT_2300819 [Mycena leptocephala]